MQPIITGQMLVMQLRVYPEISSNFRHTPPLILRCESNLEALHSEIGCNCLLLLSHEDNHCGSGLVDGLKEYKKSIDYSSETIVNLMSRCAVIRMATGRARLETFKEKKYVATSLVGMAECGCQKQILQLRHSLLVAIS